MDCGETPQDYLLTVTIDETCSSSGSPTPDTLFEGWYQWNTKGKTSSILEAPTAQDAKCIIDDFYDYVNGGYSQVTSINYNQFKYVFSDGISVGTQMYDKDTLQPITEAGTYLWIKPPPIGIAPDSPSLDSNNPTIVPNTYFIVIWGADGIIDGVTPYISLDSCGPVDPYDPVEGSEFSVISGTAESPYFAVLDSDFVEQTVPYTFAPLPNAFSDIAAVSDNYTHMVATQQGGGTCLVTNDNGESWFDTNMSGSPSISKSGQYVLLVERIYGGPDVAHLSSDYGNTFSVVDLTQAVSGGVTRIIEYPQLSGSGRSILLNVTVGQDDNRLVQSTDYGVSFENITGRIGYIKYTRGIHMSGSGQYITVLGSSDNNMSRVSSDYGQSFHNVNYPLNYDVQNAYNISMSSSYDGQYTIFSERGFGTYLNSDFGSTNTITLIDGSPIVVSQGVSTSGDKSFIQKLTNNNPIQVRVSNNAFQSYATILPADNINTTFTYVDVSTP